MYYIIYSAEFQLHDPSHFLTWWWRFVLPYQWSLHPGASLSAPAWCVCVIWAWMSYLCGDTGLLCGLSLVIFPQQKPTLFHEIVILIQPQVYHIDCREALSGLTFYICDHHLLNWYFIIIFMESKELYCIAFILTNKFIYKDPWQLKLFSLWAHKYHQDFVEFTKCNLQDLTNQNTSDLCDEMILHFPAEI